ncbi:MAG TPA: ATP-binding protein [Oscillospiraceae bacterium]|nr:ATP-binding protein [Oscillospiraceae bacterium]
MKIAILSGKGGTGKTLLAVNLAAAAMDAGYVDCDVEEPNGHLFFKPDLLGEEEVTVKIPQVDDKLCDGCRLCVEFCRYNALAYSGRLIIFDDICHSCGGCVLLCPQHALTEQDKTIGKVRRGKSEDVDVISGIMNSGEASGVPIIDRLQEYIEAMDKEEKHVFIDCPPGSSCTVMDSIKNADYCILVAEPSIFGVHNLEMVHELVKLFSKDYGVILNKCQKGENLAEEYCLNNNINILGRIPFDPELGLINSNGKIAVRESVKYHDFFSQLLGTVLKEAKVETTSNP